ncbi:hypothetical protein [Saccharomonospora xinjiangensis]|uniref:Cytotoxic translational repressor of toxin-antitoxin stability system n=1 Tax=Saccharomonospora xinjiangensis XJ-54 TaxID=882086 RepID=I0V0G4_9PSEU|nr:hypothetical protein [Saccharomonospora xinjiangensis]EID53617.1 hypothetical protein SacxiDRAFT_1366 [Saccharomonospora xinjiangensis XJ-54]
MAKPLPGHSAAGRLVSEAVSSSSDAVRGWQELLPAAPGNLRKVWDLLRHEPGELSGLSPLRHHRLKYDLAVGRHGGRELPLWQIEVTGGGRIWYLVDEENRTVWLRYAGTGHPKRTD